MVRLTAQDGQMLTRLIRSGVPLALEVRPARILLELDDNNPTAMGPVLAKALIAQRVGACAATIVNVAKVYTDRGGDVAATVRRKSGSPRPLLPGLLVRWKHGSSPWRVRNHRKAMTAGVYGCWRNMSSWPVTSRIWIIRPLGGR